MPKQELHRPKVLGMANGFIASDSDFWRNQSLLAGSVAKHHGH